MSRIVPSSICILSFRKTWYSIFLSLGLWSQCTFLKPRTSVTETNCIRPVHFYATQSMVSFDSSISASDYYFRRSLERIETCAIL